MVSPSAVHTVSPTQKRTHKEEARLSSPPPIKASRLFSHTHPPTETSKPFSLRLYEITSPSPPYVDVLAAPYNSLLPPFRLSRFVPALQPVATQEPLPADVQSCF